MLGWVVLCFLTLRFYRVAGQGDCTDLRGRLIAHGLHYVPGPDTCTLCVCDNGLPKVCKAVLCSPPQDCRSFRVGSTCCEFICLDDVVKPAEGAEDNVRMAAGGATALVLLTVALVVYRMRWQKRRRPPHADDQRSLTSIGYISGSMGYMGGTCETALAAWKPHGNYLPRGEAPPPYDEAVAQCRLEQVSRASNEPAFHRSYPATVETLARPDEPMPCTGHAYSNIARPIQQIPNPQNCFNAPLLQPVHPQEPREPNSMPHHALAPNMVGFPSAIRLTGSLGAISNRGLLSLLQRDMTGADPERHHAPPMYPHTAPMHALHRTIPRGVGAGAVLARGGGGGGGGGAEGEVRRSFHRSRALHVAARSMPRGLNLAADDVPQPLQDTSNIRTSAAGVNISAASAGPPSAATGPSVVGPGPAAGARRTDGDGCVRPAPPPPPPPTQTLPLTVDKPSCVCSYSGAGAGGDGGEGGEGGGGAGEVGEDADDYRSECENCKATANSKWAECGEEAWRGEEEEGTQTLQRRAPPPPPPNTNTLPQPVTRHPRSMLGAPSNWENWFNTIPDSDTESEEE